MVPADRNSWHARNLWVYLGSCWPSSQVCGHPWGRPDSHLFSIVPPASRCWSEWKYCRVHKDIWSCVFWSANWMQSQLISQCSLRSLDCRHASASLGGALCVFLGSSCGQRAALTRYVCPNSPQLHAKKQKKSFGLMQIESLACIQK